MVFMIRISPQLRSKLNDQNFTGIKIPISEEMRTMFNNNCKITLPLSAEMRAIFNNPYATPTSNSPTPLYPKSKSRSTKDRKLSIGSLENGKFRIARRRRDSDSKHNITSIPSKLPKICIARIDNRIEMIIRADQKHQFVANTTFTGCAECPLHEHNINIGSYHCIVIHGQARSYKRYFDLSSRSSIDNYHVAARPEVSPIPKIEEFSSSPLPAYMKRESGESDDEHQDVFREHVQKNEDISLLLKQEL
jgi:hypothetical protein